MSFARTVWQLLTFALAWVLTAPFSRWSELGSLAGQPSSALVLGRIRDNPHSSELASYISDFHSVVWWRRSYLIILRGLVLAAIISIPISAFFYVRDEVQPIWLIPIIVIVILWGMFLIHAQRVSFHDVARIVDRNLGTQEEFATGIEITVRSTSNLLSTHQLKTATSRLRDISPADAIGWRWPVGDLKVVLVVVGVSGLLVLSSLLGVRVPFISPPLEDELLTDPSDLADEYYELAPDELAMIPFGDFDVADGSFPFLEDDLYSQFDLDTTSDEFAQQLAEIEKMLLQQAELSSNSQLGLSELASSLSDASVMRDVATGINAGDFVSAANAVRALAENSDQLSPQARAELASALAQAATRTSGLTPELAEAARQASNSLLNQGASENRQALEQLAEAIAQSGLQVQQQSELGKALEDLKAGGEALGLEWDQPGQSSQQGSQDAAFGEGGTTAADLEGESINGESGVQLGDASSGLGAGRARVRSEPSSQVNPRLPPTDKFLRLRGTDTGAGVGSIQNSQGPSPLTQGDQSIASAAGRPIAPGSSQPIVVQGETNFVPLGLQQVVQEFFLFDGRQ